MTLTFKLGRDFCTTYLTAKFDRPMFSRSEVIVRRNKQTNKQTNIKQTDATANIHLASLRYTDRWVNAGLIATDFAKASRNKNDLQYAA